MQFGTFFFSFNYLFLYLAPEYNPSPFQYILIECLFFFFPLPV